MKQKNILVLAKAHGNLSSGKNLGIEEPVCLHMKISSEYLSIMENIFFDVPQKFIQSNESRVLLLKLKIFYNFHLNSL